MADVYSLLSNEYVKNKVLTYVVNNFEFKIYLIHKYLSEFFKMKPYKLRNDLFPTLDYLDKLLFNIRWYISESYLKDIKTLNGKEDLKKFWSRLQPFWHTGLFNSIDEVLLVNSILNLKLKFVLDNLGSYKELKCCLVYYEVYRLAISHEYIELNFFDKKDQYDLQYEYIKSFKFGDTCLSYSRSLREIYNSVVTLFKKFPEKYKIKDGFLVLKY